jgi:hypothetical protein
MGSLLDNVRKSLFGEPVLQQTDVTDELRGAGTAFATLIEGVGTAVATTQAELDKTSGNIATLMAQTQVETVQAVVTQYGSDGNIININVVTGTTSALSIAVPPALSFKRVHLEGSFVATEFSAAQHSNVNVNLIGVSVSGRAFGGLSASASVVNSNTDVQTEQTQDSSVASMSMTALIRPKPVTALPKPPLIFKGPSLTLTLSGNPSPNPLVMHNIPSTPTDQPYLERRSAIVQVQLVSAPPAAAIAGQTIAIDCGTLDWVVSTSAGAPIPPPAGPTTDSGGSFYITVSRTATSSTDPKKDFVIRASLNLVNANLSVSL